MKTQFIICSTEREGQHGLSDSEKERSNCYFVAIHGYSPFFSKMEKAKPFTSREAATAYAREKLFTDDSAFRVDEIETTATANR